MLTLAFHIQPAKADTGTITINADGSITPSAAPIYTADNITYTLIGNITAPVNGNGIVIERSNIVIDGAGYWVQAWGYTTPAGIYLNQVSNVTVNNSTTNAYYGIYLNYSSGNTISQSLTTDCYYGIWLESSSNNTIIANSISYSGYTDNSRFGIVLDFSNSNRISENNFTHTGLYVEGSFHNAVEDNTINDEPLVYLEGVSNRTVANGGQVVLVECENMTVEGINLSMAFYPIELWGTNNSMISQNNINNTLDGYGVWLANCSNDYIFQNNITRNDDGMWLESCTNIDIHQNNIAANIDDALSLRNCSDISISENNITNSLDEGIYLDTCSNNTISGNYLSDAYGIWLEVSSNNTISGNNVTNCSAGIYLFVSSNNSILENNIRNSWYDVAITSSSNNTASGNNVADATNSGFFLSGFSWGNIISGNNITGNPQGLWLFESSGNSIFHNRFVNNGIQAIANSSSVDVWDDGYPSGGNYWSDYNGTDLHSGPYQNQTGSDGIGDTPYVIDANNTDHYPLMSNTIPEFPSPIILSLCMIIALFAVIVLRRRNMSRVGTKS